jgi:hypothetical protein
MISGTIAYIEGVAIWSEQLPGWDIARRILRGEMDASHDTPGRPSPDLLPPNERRRAPDTVAIALEVGANACAHAQRDPSSLPSVFASTHGDLAITDYICETLALTPELMSPTRFHNSVHNAAAGYWAIATGNTQPYTALSAERYTFGSAMLEALVQAQCDKEAVLLVAYDTDARGPLATVVKSTGRLGCALVLNCQPSASTKYVLRWQTREGGTGHAADPENASLAAGNAMAVALPVFEAIARSAGHTSCAIAPTMSLDLEISTINAQAAQAAP